MSDTKIDAKSAQDRHQRRKDWFLAEATRQASNRALSAKCEAFYDGQQWTHEDSQAVQDRGQNPVVYNEVKPTIDWLIGTERRTRVDYYVVAEDEGEQANDDARLKTRLLKYLDDTNRARFERSYSAEDAFKAGIGWIEVGLRGDQSGPPVYVGAESWRYILWDSQAQKRDLSDARYIFRIKVVDFDVAQALFPDKEKELRESIQTGDDATVFQEWLGGAGLLAGLDAFTGAAHDGHDYLTTKPVDLFNTRERIMLIECWERSPFRNQEPGPHGIADPVTWRVMCSIMTEHHTLIESWSPFRNDRFPFIPVWGYRNRRTGLPYSPILPLIGPQEALNHRMSRSLYEAASNQIKIEEDAVNPEVMDFEEIRRELDSPDGMAIFAKGALSAGKVQERPNQQEARFQLELAARDTLTIRQMSGVTGENRGLDTNSISGRAVLAKQDQGSLVTMELFDNLAFARQMEGEMVLSLAEQFVVQPMTVRFGGDGGRFEYTRINDPQLDGSYKNDITKRRAHFVIGEQAWKQSIAESSFETLMNVLGQLAASAPQIVVNLLDVVFDMHPNLPRKQVILDRIRQVNGQSSPDGRLSPEQQAAKQQQALVAQAQFEAQMAKLQADIREAQAKGEKLEAESMGKRLEALYTAAQSAQVLVAAPSISPVADELLKSVGFKDMGGGNVIDVRPQPAAVQPLPQLQQTDGAQAGMHQGIQTPGADGVNPQLI